MVDQLHVVFQDPLCWFIVQVGHLLDMLDVPFYFILIDALIIFAIGVTDLCGIWSICSGGLHPVSLRYFGVAPACFIQGLYYIISQQILGSPIEPLLLMVTMVSNLWLADRCLLDV